MSKSVYVHIRFINPLPLSLWSRMSFVLAPNERRYVNPAVLVNFEAKLKLRHASPDTEPLRCYHGDPTQASRRQEVHCVAELGRLRHAVPGCWREDYPSSQPSPRPDAP